MKLTDAVKYFGSQRNIAKALDIDPSAVTLWKTRDCGIVPMRHIIKLKDLSMGELDLILDDYRKKPMTMVYGGKA